MFKPLPDKPDHPALELEILDLWEREDTFERLRQQNRGGPKFSFVDGPVTANKIARRPHRVGAHAEGRLPALQGAAGLRPALPERVRLPGPLDRGRRRAPARASTRSGRSRSSASRSSPRAAARSSSGPREELTEGSIRLGQWMDWGKDYFTFSDTNIEYIWRFLRIVHERGWLYLGHRSTEWCPRCGTSISAHELAGSYVDRADPSLFVRFPLLDRPGEALVDLDDDAVDAARQRGRRGQARRRVRPARERRLGRRRALPGRDVRGARAPAPSSSGWRYEGPFDDARARRGRRAPRDPVGRRHARRRHRHRPHRARLRLGGLRALACARPAGADAGRRVGPVLRRLRLAARALDGRGGRADHRLPRGARAPRRGRACTSTATRSAGAATRR